MREVGLQLYELQLATERLCKFAERVNEGVMSNGLAYKRDALRDEIASVRFLIEKQKKARRAASPEGK